MVRHSIGTYMHQHALANKEWRRAFIELRKRMEPAVVIESLLNTSPPVAFCSEWLRKQKIHSGLGSLISYAG